jgi:regulator of replication initiation timing
MDIKSELINISSDIESITEPTIKNIINKLLNIIEAQAQEIQQLREENQKLRDENNRLKGEQGKPDIRKQTANKNISSEKERKRKKDRKAKKKARKKTKLAVKRTEICDMDKNQLPKDAVFKGYQPIIVQDISIQAENIEFKRAIYYSALLKKTFIAPLPTGYEDGWGPHLKALVLDLRHTSKMTESAIHRFLQNQGVDISPATISRLLINHQEGFHQEKKAIVTAGLASSLHQQMDDTGARVKGKNYYTHILCNTVYTAYFTRPHKDRLTIIDILTQGELIFRFNESSYALMELMKLPKKRLIQLQQSHPSEIMNREQVDDFLKTLLPTPNKHQTSQRIILEASAITGYQQRPNAVSLLLTDDAPQFKQITELLALCWIHDGRHYKKLEPIVPLHRTLLENFLNAYWDYYHQLLRYKQTPLPSEAEQLSHDFDTLFSTKTGYAKLDERIEKTKLKKDSLLLVLQHPTLPLHNNDAELGARVQARYRDISLHTMSEKGTEAKDTFMTIVETAKKLSVNTYHYFYDRLSKNFKMASLADLITATSQ